MEKRKYLQISAGQSAHGWQIGQHWLAGNSFFPCGKIFIFSFSELLGINIEGLNSLLLGIQLFTGATEANAQSAQLRKVRNCAPTF